MGDARYERAYYRCRHCHTGHFPTDAEYGIQRQQTPAASEVIALMGVLEPFEEGAHALLPRLSGIHVSPSTVQTTTETFGEDVAQRRDQGETFGSQQTWNWHHDAEGKTVGYVGLDATGVRQQGLHAEQAEGRMAWVGTVFNPEPMHQKRRLRVWDSRYVAGLMSLPEIGAQLRKECQAVGLDKADRVVALTDGGQGLENCLIETLGGVAQEIVFILDFWHASEHLQEFAKALLPDETTRQEQMKLWCHQLKHAGGASLLSALEGLDLSRTSPQAKELHRQLTGYFRHNLHRMNYPDYIQKGWQIGSGKVESACKSVVGRRLKGPGMRWREAGTTALCQLRALYKSKLWTTYWTRSAVP